MLGLERSRRARNGPSERVGEMEWPLLSSLSDDERRALLATCRRRHFALSDVIFYEGDPAESIHLLTSGTIAIRMTTPIGDVATLDVLAPGESFGEQALLAEPPVRFATVVALEAAETLSLARSNFHQLLAEHPTALRLLVDALDARLRATSRNLVNVLYMSVEARVFHNLVRLHAIYASQGSIPLTQDDLASLAGTSRQSLNVVLRHAQKDGLLTLSRGKVVINDPEGIATALADRPRAGSRRWPEAIKAGRGAGRRVVKSYVVCLTFCLSARRQTEPRGQHTMVVGPHQSR
jgi:CRP/FNR family cyclic AMP-dependent transcriptional regulator